MFHAALMTLAVLTAPAPDAPESPKPAKNRLDPVCEMKASPKDQTVAVRGREYRVCSKRCAKELAKDPDAYLEKDGSVKAEKPKAKKK